MRAHYRLRCNRLTAPDFSSGADLHPCSLSPSSFCCREAAYFTTRACATARVAPCLDIARASLHSAVLPWHMRVLQLRRFVPDAAIRSRYLSLYAVTAAMRSVTRQRCHRTVKHGALVRARHPLPPLADFAYGICAAHSPPPRSFRLSCVLPAKIPTGDAAKGAKIFKTKCSQCHTVDKAGGNKQGPNLHGVLGRHAGTVDGFAYTKANSESGIKWQANTLTYWRTTSSKSSSNPAQSRLLFTVLTASLSSVVWWLVLPQGRAASVRVPAGPQEVHPWHQDGVRRTEEAGGARRSHRIPQAELVSQRGDRDVERETEW